jgi:hypothetical protein
MTKITNLFCIPVKIRNLRLFSLFYCKSDIFLFFSIFNVKQYNVKKVLFVFKMIKFFNFSLVENLLIFFWLFSSSFLIERKLQANRLEHKH